MGSDRGAGGHPGMAARCTLRPRPSTASSGTLLMDTSEYYLVVCFALIHCPQIPVLLSWNNNYSMIVVAC